MGRASHSEGVGQSATGTRDGPTIVFGHAILGTEGRTPATIVSYHATVHDLYRMMVREAQRPGEYDDVPLTDVIGCLVEWFQSQDERWRPATIRGHRSALVCWIETVLPCSPDHDEDDIARALGAALDLEAGPAPRPSTEPKRTSARKRKSLPPDDHARILYELTPRPGPGGPKADGLTRLCRLMVRHLPHLGLRPVEVHGASTTSEDCDPDIGTTSDPDAGYNAGAFLRVLNAKATNGRANGPVRTLDLSDFDTRDRAEIEEMIALAVTQLEKVGCAELLHGRLSERLARACDRAEVKRVCFYTLRHQALATAKAHLPVEEASALAGHGVTRTITERYAPARQGWREAPRVRPVPEDVARVHDNARSYAMRNDRRRNAVPVP